jgi:hypothetical protein
MVYLGHNQKGKVMKTIEIETHLAGSKAQYFVGVVKDVHGRVIARHTSKSRRYLEKVLKNKAR